ncbi:uncharacterized protein [Oscarella lobularis]|uniref:uncharacterized protein isoform X2 n=1 Tax=Oscarella lobularis TaxID=121494 RepID=UPI0033133763
MLAVLFKYFAEKERLRVGGLLLPQLIEFYMWLTEDVCHLLTIEQASSKPIAELVTKIADSYAEEKAEHIKKLFENVRDQYNKYVKLVSGDVKGSREGVYRLYEITEKSVLQSDRKGEGLDAFFSAIEDLITNQNQFLELAYHEIGKGIFPNYLSSNMVTIQPLQVVLPSCLLGDISPSELDNGPSDNGVWKFGADLLKIIQRNYLYVPGVGIEEDVGAGYSRFGYSNFDFRRIQLSVMETFIFGKPQIANPVCIRRTTFFKSKVEIGRSDSVFRQDLFSRMAFFRQQLPEQFAAELSSDLLIGAEILFHDLSYENLSDVLKCLLTVTGDFCQVKMKESDEDRAKCSELKDFSLEEFSKFSSTVEEQCFSDFSVASKIGLRRLGEEQIRWLLEIRVFQLHAAFCFFFRKLENEDYEYAHLPLTIKVRLEKDDREAIVKAVKDQTVGPELLQSLKDLDQALHAPEAVIHMNRNPQETLRTYLEPFYDKGDFILSLFSGSVRLKHSVQVRMCIRG